MQGLCRNVLNGHGAGVRVDIVVIQIEIDYSQCREQETDNRTGGDGHPDEELPCDAIGWVR